MSKGWAVMALLLASMDGAVRAETPACGAPDASLPEELAAWRSAGVAPSALTPGITTKARFLEQDAVRYAIPPERAAPAGMFGAVLPLRIAAAGTYRIALEKGGWVDVVSGGKAVASIAHGHGPTCSTIRKIVDFSLTPGDYVVQLSGVNASDGKILVARKP